ncbi:MAG: ACT domain-containing protein [Gammaproteobacteria bacterium]
MKQQLVLAVLGNHKTGVIEKLTKSIHDSGANIIDSRMGNMGNELGMLLLVAGSWDTIAKIEDTLPRLESELGAKISSTRTGKRQTNNRQIPYTIEIVCSDRKGIIHDVVKFFLENQIDICELYSNTYQSPHTDVTMFSMHMIVNIPVDSSIASIRTEFMDFCDHLNLDAVMEPAK